LQKKLRDGKEDETGMLPTPLLPFSPGRPACFNIKEKPQKGELTERKKRDTGKRSRKKLRFPSSDLVPFVRLEMIINRAQWKIIRERKH